MPSPNAVRHAGAGSSPIEDLLLSPQNAEENKETTREWHFGFGLPTDIQVDIVLHSPSLLDAIIVR